MNSKIWYQGAIKAAWKWSTKRRIRSGNSSWCPPFNTFHNIFKKKTCGAVQTSSEEKESAFLSACSFPNSLLIRDGATDLCWVTNETHCKSSEQNNNIFAWACVYVWACTCGQVLNIVLHWTFKADLVPLWATCGLRCLCHSSCG